MTEPQQRDIAFSLSGFVLAGGRSARMGRDKALLSYRGRPLIEYALEKLQAVCIAPRIAGSRLDLTAFAPVIEDLHPGLGPLSGIEAALNASQSELNVFLPVDLPLLPSELLRWMISRAAITEAVATIPALLGCPQPLCAVFRRELLPGITKALERGDFKVMRAISGASKSLSGRVDLFSVEAVAPTQWLWPPDSPPHRWFQNLNRPEDLASIA